MVMQHISYAKNNRYIVIGIDSTELQYSITIMRVSNHEIFTIYSYKSTSEDIEEFIKKRYKKIIKGEVYKLKFEEHLIPQPEFRYDSKGNKVHWFYIDRLEGLYYNSSPISIFRRRNYWKPKKNG